MIFEYVLKSDFQQEILYICSRFS